MGNKKKFEERKGLSKRDAILEMASETEKSSESNTDIKSQVDQDWYVECSDDEVYTKSGYVRGKMSSWQPDPKDVVELLETSEKNGSESITLDWTCPGRRPLTPSTESEYSDSDDEARREAAKAAMDFDFDADEDLKMTPTFASGRKGLPGSAQRELKGSARKRTSDYKSIVSNLKKEQQQRKLNEAEIKIRDQHHHDHFN